MKGWTFIDNHGLVLLYISQNPRCTTRQMAAAVNVTERTIRRILDDLSAEEYITWERTGKSNVYNINTERELKHTLTRDVKVQELLELLGGIIK